MIQVSGNQERILDVLRRAARPMSAYEILDQLRRQRATAPPTVYRALAKLQAGGLVHRLEALNAYACCDHPGHASDSQFLICAQCGAVDEVIDKAVATAVSDLAGRRGFVPERQAVEVMGLCADCRDGPA
jgi:Fur family zinc uptake transcriptional regulator